MRGPLDLMPAARGRIVGELHRAPPRLSQAALLLDGAAIGIQRPIGMPVEWIQPIQFASRMNRNS